MSDELHRVVYLSSATQGFPPEALEELLVGAREENAKQGITGVLLYHDGSFFQVLEGPKSAVLETLDRIRADGRHGGIITLENRACLRTTFPDWSMGYLEVDALNESQREGFFELSAAARGSGTLALCRNTPIAVFLDSFLNSFREFEQV